MIYYMYNINKPYIMSVDIEYDKNQIVQIGAIMLKQIGKYVYQTCRSLNTYILENSVSPFVQEYTNITNDFLHEYGVTIEEAKNQWIDFLSDIRYDDLLVVSHGIHQDSIMLKESGFDIDMYEHWCTYNMSKWVLERENHLTLSDVLKESGCIPICEHNAYADARSTLDIFSYLLKREGDSKL